LPNPDQPPATDEIEISIFGPGKGESIAVHVGGGQWLIVDSCVDQHTKQIPVVEYLRRLRVDLATDVVLVVGTHAHDDHIAGLSRVLALCESATFVCSSALTSEEFLATVEADADIERLFRKTIRSEYRRIFDIVDQRDARGTTLPAMRAVELRELWSRPAFQETPAASAIALSPSDLAASRALSAIGAGLAKATERRLMQRVDPNEFAVAMWVTVGDVAMLLGADLTKGPEGCGWNAVVTRFAPTTRASAFKIPHHGSPNAHHDDVWSRLVSDDAIALIAPYRMGYRPLPADEDVQRIKMSAAATYCSANPKAPALSKDVKRTRSALASLGATNVRFEGKTGQVRARRARDSDAWRVECIPPAMEL
jgi:beta-lactamase superfamily II metal-dependent hydrolase